MANKFHNINGMLLVGLDLHDGRDLLLPPIPPQKFLELNVAHPFWMGPNQKPTVQIDGANAVVDKHTPVVLWPHFPVVPHPLNLLFPLDLVFGTQSCWLPRGSVHICGTPAAPTVFPCELSVNLDCWLIGLKLPTSLILQPGTVETTPTAGDYLKGAVRALIDNLVAVALNYVGKKAPGPVTAQSPGTILRNALLSKINPFSKGHNAVGNFVRIGNRALNTVGISASNVVNPSSEGGFFRSPFQPASTPEGVAKNAVKSAVPLLAPPINVADALSN
jgi:hypothetical protein